MPRRRKRLPVARRMPKCLRTPNRHGSSAKLVPSGDYPFRILKYLRISGAPGRRFRISAGLSISF